MSAQDIKAHIRACGMNMKKYNKIKDVVLKILDPEKNANPTEDSFLKSFALKCYGNLGKEEGKKQARKFLKVLYDDLNILVKEGPVVALELASQKNKGSKKPMRIFRLNKPIDGFTKKLDCYLIGSTIGKGATSVVKQGRHQGDEKQEVAIKVLTVSGKNFELEELMREIEVLRELDHKNVIKMYECYDNVHYPGYSEKSTVVMVLELATKGELFDFFMHTGRFKAPLARWFFKQMIDGLEYCHSKKIAHRDLKPENILLGEGFNVKLVDFGFARFFRDEKTGKEVRMKTALGTPGYAAPEILSRKKYDYRVDIFSLGVILFICIAGFPPFQEAKASDWWFDKIIKKKYALFWKAHERCIRFDKDAKDILLGMLAARPVDRYGWKKLRNHKWTNGKTFTQEEASKTLMNLKIRVDAAIAKAARDQPEKVRRVPIDAEENIPVLGNFLPVQHIFTSLPGKLALEEIRDYITNRMLGKARLLPTELWVGPVPAMGIEDYKINDEKGGELGFYWEDLEFTVNLHDEVDEKATVDDDEIPIMKNSVIVQGMVVVRRHPTEKTKDGKPLNVIYFKRIGNTMPHNWQQVAVTIFKGVAHMMVDMQTKYFRGVNSIKKTVAASEALEDDIKNASDSEKTVADNAALGDYKMKTIPINSALAATNSAVSSLLCCTTGAAKTQTG